MTYNAKGKRSPGKLKTMGDYNEFFNRISKSLYYSKLPITDRLSLPVIEFAAELFSEVKIGCSLERLDAEEASRISRNACVSPCSFVLALLYLERLKDCNPEYLYKIAPSELFLVSLMVASKFLNDDGEEDEVSNTKWARSGELSLAHINRLEKEFLNAINWTIYVYDEDFWSRLRKLEKDIAYKEAKKRGWFSYTELSCLMDTKNLSDVIQALISISSVCLATYTAGVLMLLSSAMIASYIPGTSLAPKQSFLRENSNIQFVEDVNDAIVNTKPDYFDEMDCPKFRIASRCDCDANQSSIEVSMIKLSSCIASAMTWLANDSQSNHLTSPTTIDVDKLQNPSTFITNSRSIASSRQWEDLIVEINWKETLETIMEHGREDWRYYVDYVTKISLGHRH